jgi:hypothetical protein
MKNSFSRLRRWGPIRLLHKLSVWLAGDSSLSNGRRADPADFGSRLCPTVALERVAVRPERRRPPAR